jgi:hypothetical protein
MKEDFSYDLTVSLICVKSSHVHKGTTLGSLFTVPSHGELYQMRAIYVFIYGLCNWSTLKVKAAELLQPACKDEQTYHNTQF